MKKNAKILMLIICLFLVGGCKIYVYNFDDQNKTPENEQGPSNLTGSNTGTTIINPETNYQGFIKYATEVPNTETSWDIIYDKIITY